MQQLAEIDLPDLFIIDYLEQNVNGETNDVFFCNGQFAGRPISAYLKVNKNPRLSLANEQDILIALANSDIPVPTVLWYSDEKKEVLIIEALGGEMIWEYIDPRRGHYDSGKSLLYLHAYGECLGRIHSVEIAWPAQKRVRLHGLIGEEELEDERFRRLVAWFQANNAATPGQVLVHGDYNTANVLCRNEAVSGVLDWEFAGSGWREYDLAWTLRARTHFLNLPAEREALLAGYTQRCSYDEEALRWCEVLNYLHFAYWNRESKPSSASFDLARGMEIAGIA